MSYVGSAKHRTLLCGSVEQAHRAVRTLSVSTTAAATWTSPPGPPASRMRTKPRPPRPGLTVFGRDAAWAGLGYREPKLDRPALSAWGNIRLIKSIGSGSCSGYEKGSLRGWGVGVPPTTSGTQKAHQSRGWHSISVRGSPRRPAPTRRDGGCGPLTAPGISRAKFQSLAHFPAAVGPAATTVGGRHAAPRHAPRVPP